MAIPRFSLSDDRFQAADSVKFLILSTRTFEISPDRPAAFAADFAVTSIGGDPADFRRAIAPVGLGIFTMLPIRDGRSRSLHGQGASARYRRFRTRGVDAQAR